MSKISLKSGQIQVLSKSHRANRLKMSKKQIKMTIFGEVIALPPISTHLRVTSILDIVSTQKMAKINFDIIKVIILWTRGYF